MWNHFFATLITRSALGRPVPGSGPRAAARAKQAAEGDENEEFRALSARPWGGPDIGAACFCSTQ